MPRALVWMLLLALGCFPRVSVPEGERERASRDLEGQRRFTQVALFTGPFFGDATHLLVSDQPFGELDLLQSTSGETIAPPRAERVLPPGTPVAIDKVEFPTGWLIAKRVVMTPRYHPWVYLKAEGEARPLVVVLPQTLTTAEEVRVELERILGTVDPSPALAALPEAQRTAVLRKDVVEGMGPQAVEMAWGYPQKKVVDRPARTEAWTWPGGRRRAWFADGQLARFEIARTPAPASAAR
ncbi:MAG TPA: hypothetical protein VFP65_13325 [Anaeromyxobacteraceae bacterium]|nr:hypothetical protein [Anaeromyxobacteraceae bacterium]